MIRSHSVKEEGFKYPDPPRPRRNPATINNTVYIQGRTLAFKAILHKILLVSGGGYHLRASSKAGWFIYSDQEILFVDPITGLPIQEGDPEEDVPWTRALR